jgi:aspartate oxidase
VFGKRAALADGGSPPDVGDGTPLAPEPAGAMALAVIRELADRDLGVRRDGPALEALAHELEVAADPGGGRAATLVAWLMASAARRRTESRGGQYRVDFPEPDPAWQLRQAVDRHGWSMLASLGRV